jgi:uncharacterized FlaG/YvyC family protein
MDVQSVAPATGTADGSQPAAPTAAPDGSTEPTATGAVAQASSQPGSASHVLAQDSSLASAIAKLYNVAGSSSNDANIGVSYKVVPGLDLVVTVFTNADTGEEIAQFPPELLVGVAQFFDQLDGVTIDKKV